MVTVATSLDVPIKLVFPGPKRGGMLGLGDVVLPGIMMAMALRFDLYLHYFRMQGQPEAPFASETTPMNPLHRAKAIRKQVPYQEAAGHWGERFWTRNAKRGGEPTAADASRFPKVYFKASLVGYVIAMMMTVAILNLFDHAQPALLYLVPCVTGSLWGTALVRGEVNLMWNYTEDGSLETSTAGDKRVAPNADTAGSGEGPSDSPDASSESNDASEDGTVVVSNGSAIKNDPHEHAHHVFLFSLSSPKKGAPRKAKLFATA